MDRHMVYMPQMRTDITLWLPIRLQPKPNNKLLLEIHKQCADLCVLLAARCPICTLLSNVPAHL